MKIWRKSLFKNFNMLLALHHCMVFRFSPTEHDDANTIKNDDGGGVGGYDLILRNSHISKNISLLISLGAGDVIVDICCSPKALPGNLSLRVYSSKGPIVILGHIVSASG